MRTNAFTCRDELVVDHLLEVQWIVRGTLFCGGIDRNFLNSKIYKRVRVMISSSWNAHPVQTKPHEFKSYVCGTNFHCNEDLNIHAFSERFFSTPTGIKNGFSGSSLVERGVFNALSFSNEHFLHGILLTLLALPVYRKFPTKRGVQVLNVFMHAMKLNDSKDAEDHFVGLSILNAFVLQGYCVGGFYVHALSKFEECSTLSEKAKEYMSNFRSGIDHKISYVEKVFQSANVSAKGLRFSSEQILTFLVEVSEVVENL
jgi:hypothetical protein